MTIASAEEFVRLRTSETPEDYRRAAGEDAPLDVWYAVIAQHPEMRFWVAQNKTVPTAVLELLSADADPRVRTMVASKRRASAGVLTRLAADRDDGVRAAVARNPRTPAPLLERLSGDAVAQVADVARRRLDG
jgi:hypothetical protein